MIGGKQIHREWMKRGKKMKLVLVLQSDEQMKRRNLANCAKQITKELSLEKIKLKNKTEYPVWIQEIKLTKPLGSWGNDNSDEIYDFYYLVFIALKGKIDKLTLNNLKNISCLENLEDVTPTKDSLINKVTNMIKSNNATNNYVKEVNNFEKLTSISQSGGYVKLSNGKTRKVRTSKNGTKYILLNGKKVKV